MQSAVTSHADSQVDGGFFDYSSCCVDVLGLRVLGTLKALSRVGDIFVVMSSSTLWLAFSDSGSCASERHARAEFSTCMHSVDLQKFCLVKSRQYLVE